VAPSHREGRLSTLVLYHDFVSPFSRLALLVARNVAREVGLDLRLVPLELFPPPVPLPPAPETLGAELEAALPLARALGAELALPARVPRTRKAHEALVHARRQGEGMGQREGMGQGQGQGQGEGLELELAEALYDAVWRRGQDIGRLDVLAGLGAEVGLDRGRRAGPPRPPGSTACPRSGWATMWPWVSSRRLSYWSGSGRASDGSDPVAGRAGVSGRGGAPCPAGLVGITFTAMARLRAYGAARTPNSS
jgi:2-hydroxychromene-2-carboxylate isomerase